MVKSQKLIRPQKFIRAFALMCQKSKTTEDDWQGDGWGIALKMKNYEWQVYKSLKPIWEDQEGFSQFQKTKMFVVHSRSASFVSQKGIVEYNQPYVSDDYCFVFNGMLKGVKIRRKSRGKIGAQKIFNLLLDNLKTNSPKNSLRRVEQLLLRNSKKLEGLNIGLAYKDKFYVLCQHQSEYEDYFSIRYNMDKDPTIVVSEEIDNYFFKKMRKGEIKVF